jgi:hypothetical protein
VESPPLAHILCVTKNNLLIRGRPETYSQRIRQIDADGIKNFLEVFCSHAFHRLLPLLLPTTANFGTRRVPRRHVVLAVGAEELGAHGRRAGLRYDAGDDGVVFIPGIGEHVGRGAAAVDAEYRNTFWIAAEGGNIVADPFEREALVEEAKIYVREAWAVGKPEDVYSVADLRYRFVREEDGRMLRRAYLMDTTTTSFSAASLAPL